MKGADVVYPDITDQLHASGHANQEDMKYLARFTKPRFFVPIGGTVRHQRQYQRLMVELGYENNQVFTLGEGETIYFTQNKAYRGQTIETKNIYVDAYGIGDVGKIVLRDRKNLASEGIMVAILTVDNQGRLLTEPKILSRGFVFEKEEKVLYHRAVNELQRITKPKGQRGLNINNIRKQAVETLENLFLKERGRKPMVAVEIVQI